MSMRSYDNMTIVPNVVSDVPHRSSVNTGVDCFGIHLDVPMVASPMPDVCNGKMAYALSNSALGIIHRFQSIELQVYQYLEGFRSCNDEYISSNFEHFRKNIACAIASTGDYQERFMELYKAGCRIFCIDTANGSHTGTGVAVKWIREWEIKNGYDKLSITKKDEKADKVYIIAGNVAAWTGYLYLASLGVDAARVGIAGGSVCETRNETGVYLPTLESVCRIVEERTKYMKYTDNKEWPLIIADGGIRRPADMNIALACGADLIMGGSIFSGYAEAPGQSFNENGVLYKHYRGAASFGVQLEASGDEPDYVEGRETRILYKRGGVRRAISQFKHGLQSCASYVGALNLNEFRENVTVERL